VDDYSHYQFTPRDLTQWVMSLLRYDLTGAANPHSSDTVLEIWAYEARRLFRDRIVGHDSQAKFDKLLYSVVRADWSANIFDEMDGEKIRAVLKKENKVSLISFTVDIHTVASREAPRCLEEDFLWTELENTAVSKKNLLINLFHCENSCCCLSKRFF
jgi:hypothetical protein